MANQRAGKSAKCLARSGRNRTKGKYSRQEMRTEARKRRVREGNTCKLRRMERRRGARV